MTYAIDPPRRRLVLGIQLEVGRLGSLRQSRDVLAASS